MNRTATGRGEPAKRRPSCRPSRPGCAHGWSARAKGYVFHIPGPSLSVFHYIPVLFPLAFAAAVAWFFLPAMLTLPMPDLIRYFVPGVHRSFLHCGPRRVGAAERASPEEPVRAHHRHEGLSSRGGAEAGKAIHRRDPRRRTGGPRCAHSKARSWTRLKSPG